MRSRQASRRVVVTGAGVVSPVGVGVEPFWTSLLAGRSGIRPIERFDTSALPVRIAGDVVDFDPGDRIPRKISRRMDRYAQFAFTAAMEAVETAGLTITPEMRDRTCVMMGSGYGAGSMVYTSALAMHARGYRAVFPYLATSAAVDSAGAEIATALGANGASNTIATACATGTSAVGEAMRMIRHGYADVVVAGGADDAVNPLDLSAAALVGALSRREDEPERASRPFDVSRDGFVMGAGAGALVLESAEHAHRRGATVWAEVLGYAATTDAYHSSHPHPEGLQVRRAMREALQDAGIGPPEVEYVNAHGTSTRLNDAIEIEAFRAVFGDRAPQVPISSIKSMIGHLIGGAGAVEAVACVQALRTGWLPPTINCDEPEDPQIDYVAHEARAKPVRVVMSNSFGFGGRNAVLVLAAAGGPRGGPDEGQDDHPQHSGG